jgi:hypothetical protein
VDSGGSRSAPVTGSCEQGSKIFGFITIYGMSSSAQGRENWNSGMKLSLCLTRLHTVKEYVGVEAYVHELLTSTLAGSGWVWTLWRNLLSLLGTEPRFLDFPARRLVTIVTELPALRFIRR